MASLLNNTARKYSLAVTVNGVPRLLKVMPKLNTLESLQLFKFKSNEWMKTEVDFNDALAAAVELEYVKVLIDKGAFVVNLLETPSPDPEIVEAVREIEGAVREIEEEIEEEEKPKRKTKRGRPKKSY